MVSQKSDTSPGNGVPLPSDEVRAPLFHPLRFSNLPGWQEDDHAAALACFRISARRMAAKPYTTKKMGVDAAALAKAGVAALALEANGNATEAKAFFEKWFRPHRMVPAAGDGDKTNLSGPAFSGFVTGYFEPEIKASPIRTNAYRFPILARPHDLVEIDDTTRPAHIDPVFFFARETDAGLETYYDRGEIEQGALDGQGLELFWFENRIDIFFIHIQGSARLILPNGKTARISYAAKSGHPFTAIGKLLIERGELTRETVTMQSIRRWLEDHPQEADDLMRENRSYIFFQPVEHPEPQLGPVAAAGVPLTPGRSLAVDHRLQTFGVPIFISTEKPLPGDENPFARLMIAQDTGSAIVGPERGDLFIGTGKEAGEVAGAIKHAADFVVLLPIGTDGPTGVTKP